MIVNMNEDTFSKFVELKEYIVDEKGEGISTKKLVAIMVDMFYEKLMNTNRELEED